MSLRKNVCPECGGSITAWFDVNTEVQYAVRPNGSLSKARVVADDTGESRFGASVFDTPAYAVMQIVVGAIVVVVGDKLRRMINRHIILEGGQG